MCLVVCNSPNVGMVILAMAVLCPSWVRLSHLPIAGLDAAVKSPSNEKLVSDDSPDPATSASIDREERFEDRNHGCSLDALPGSPPVAAASTNPPQRAARTVSGEYFLSLLASLTARAPPSVSPYH
jgi:hypothetical protein